MGRKNSDKHVFLKIWLAVPLEPVFLASQLWKWEVIEMEETRLLCYLRYVLRVCLAKHCKYPSFLEKDFEK